MGKQKGAPKTGGRQKGTPNKATRELRGLMCEFVEGHFDEVKEKMAELEPAQWLRAYTDFCKFVLPTLQSVQMEGAQTLTIEQQLEELSQS